MGIVAADDGTPRHVCLECGFSDEPGATLERRSAD
jgi:hypothetical protein